MNIEVCNCGNMPHVVDYFIKGVANRKNWFVKCDNCRARTRRRNSYVKAVEEWNQYRDELFNKEG